MSKYSNYDVPPPYSFNGDLRSDVFGEKPRLKQVIIPSCPMQPDYQVCANYPMQTDYPIQNYRTVNNFNSNYYHNKKVKKYHGPVSNVQEDPNKMVRVTVKKHNSRTGKTTKESSIMNLNSYNYNYGVFPNKNVYINGLEPMPSHLVGHSYNSREQYFREQQRLLLNKQINERVRFHAQRIYPNICFQ